MTDVIDNPYWEEVKDHAKPSERRPWGDGVGLQVLEVPVGQFHNCIWANRDDLVAKYSWTITDPDSVAFVALHAGKGLVDPMAGTGYWGYVLSHLGCRVASYDKEPGTNHWHQDHKLWMPVTEADCEVSVACHSASLTLLLSWPPMNDSGARALKAYDGRRVIYIGEDAGGCTGGDELHDLLEAQWNEVARHRPVQWWGLHDYITVFERKA